MTEFLILLLMTVLRYTWASFHMIHRRTKPKTRDPHSRMVNFSSNYRRAKEFLNSHFPPLDIPRQWAAYFKWLNESWEMCNESAGRYRLWSHTRLGLRCRLSHLCKVRPGTKAFILTTLTFCTGAGYPKGRGQVPRSEGCKLSPCPERVTA